MESGIFSILIVLTIFIGLYLMGLGRSKFLRLLGFMILFITPSLWIISIFSFDLSELTAKVSIFSMVAGLLIGGFIVQKLRQRSWKD